MSWKDPVFHNQQFQQQFPSDYYCEGYLLKKINEVKIRLYYDMQSLSADDMRDMAHQLNHVVEHIARMEVDVDLA